MLRWAKRAMERVTLRDKDYAFLFGRNDSGECVSLDCETTGLDPWVDDIISVAAVKIRGRRILTSEPFRAVVKPEAAIREAAIKVHMLREKDVEQGRSIWEVLPELLRFIGPRPLVGYWIEFDVQMLNKYVLEMLNVTLPNRQFDVSPMYYASKYGNAPQGTALDLRFATILADLKLPARHAHDAFNDAVSAAEMYVVLEDMRERGVKLSRPRDAARTIAPPAG